MNYKDSIAIIQKNKNPEDKEVKIDFLRPNKYPKSFAREY